MPTLIVPARPPSGCARRAPLGSGALALGLAGYGLWRAYVGYTRHGVAAALYWPRPYLALAGLSLLLAALSALALRRHRRRRWTLGPQGVLIAPQGVTVPWDEVTGVVYGPGQRLRLLTARGTFTLRPHPDRWDAAVRHLEAHLYPVLAARWKAAWDVGQPIPWGPLAVHPLGLRWGRRWLPWARVRRLAIAQGRLVIEWDNGARDLPLRRVPNGALMLRWLHQEGRR